MYYYGKFFSSKHFVLSHRDQWLGFYATIFVKAFNNDCTVNGGLIPVQHVLIINCTRP